MIGLALWLVKEPEGYFVRRAGLPVWVEHIRLRRSVR